MKKLLLSAAVLALVAGAASAQCGPQGCPVVRDRGPAAQPVVQAVAQAPARLASVAAGAVARPLQAAGCSTCGPRQGGPVRRLVARVRGR